MVLGRLEEQAQPGFPARALLTVTGYQGEGGGGSNRPRPEEPHRGPDLLQAVRKGGQGGLGSRGPLPLRAGWRPPGPEMPISLIRLTVSARVGEHMQLVQRVGRVPECLRRAIYEGVDNPVPVSNTAHFPSEAIE